MKDHLSEKFIKFEKYAPRLVECHVVLKKEKYLYGAELTLLAKNLRAYGDAKSKDSIFTAIDQACMRVEKQLKKFREKVKDHHKHPVAESKRGGGLAEILGSEEKSAARKPLVIPARSFAAKPMSAAEASLQLELSRKPFLMFRNAGTGDVNVIFKREDGNHGLIEPET